MKSIKTYKKDWCIKITNENINVVRKYLTSIDPSINKYCWTIGSYYGIFKNGHVHGQRYTISKNLISDEEFNQMINANDNYEIY